MTQQYYIGFLLLFCCCLLEALPRPSNDEFHGIPEYGRRFTRRPDEYNYDGMRFGKGILKTEIPDVMIFLRPKAHAESVKGVAIANPISNVVIARSTTGSIVHSPQASAIAGPGGIAHALSELNLATVQYLPFYGGAKGQYLEIKKDNTGLVTSEKIVSEDKISSENVVKNSDENLLSKVLAANLQQLRTLTNNLLKLHTLGRKTGRLGNTEKNRYKGQLAALGEAASNTIKLVDEIGDNIDALFARNSTTLRRAGQRYEDDDDVGEEGVGIDAEDQSSPSLDYDSLSDGETIAEAKPIGLAVIGEHGIAASRPVGTAVALHGVALAGPIATAIAGINPSDLGINFQVNHSG